MDRVIDCHAHIQPHHQVKPEALKVIRARLGPRRERAEFLRRPRRFVAYLDAIGSDQAWLINYGSPDVIGFPPEVNDWVAAYAKDFPDRLRPFGSVHPLVTADCRREAERLLSKLEVSGLEGHPPHQGVAPHPAPGLPPPSRPAARLRRRGAARGAGDVPHRDQHLPEGALPTWRPPARRRRGGGLPRPDDP